MINCTLLLLCALHYPLVRPPSAPYSSSISQSAQPAQERAVPTITTDIRSCVRSRGTSLRPRVRTAAAAAAAAAANTAAATAAAALVVRALSLYTMLLLLLLLLLRCIPLLL
jgi:hypothetical protein